MFVWISNFVQFSLISIIVISGIVLQSWQDYIFKDFPPTKVQIVLRVNSYSRKNL